MICSGRPLVKRDSVAVTKSIWTRDGRGIGSTVSFFSGILLITAIRDELPGSGHVHFRSFLRGSVGFAVLLLVSEALGYRG